MIMLKEIGWVAGFLEGEGYFGFARSSPVINATQVQLEPLLRLRALLGGSLDYFSRKEVTGNLYHRWRIHAAKAIAIMYMIWPMMSPKRKKQMLEVIRYWKSRPGRGNYIHKANTISRNLAISEGMKKSIAERKRIGVYKNH